MSDIKPPSPFPPALATSTAPVAAAPQVETRPLPVVSPAAAYFQAGQFDLDVDSYRVYANRQTGYSNLDFLQPFYPGLYVLGAISSLGKTTFSHQLADQLAAHGEDVLYFSLEQTRFELFSKSLSRVFFRFAEEMAAQGKHYPQYTSMELRRGYANGSPELQDVQDDYTQAVGNRLNVIECNFSVTVEDIQDATTAWMKQTGRKPVVIIDYLQIISPTLINGRMPDTKNSIDHIVHSIKCFQSSLNLSVLVISSLNRQNYMSPVDFESFKESGGIEYTADVIWGLQLSVLNDELFGRDGHIKEKRELIREAKAATPRVIDLVYLKNRYGPSGYGAGFNYYPAYDTFKVVPPAAAVAGITGKA